MSGDGDCDGSFVRTTTGVTKSSTHIAQDDWNGDSTPDFVPTMGNNYEISYSNGFGMIFFRVEDVRKSRYVTVHTIKYPSTSTSANLENPSLHVGAYATSIGATTAIDVYATYLSGYVTSGDERVRNPRSFSNTKTIGTTETNVLTIRSKRMYNGLANQGEIAPIILTVANDGTKSAVFRIRGNPTIGGTTNFQDIGTNLMSESETAGTTATGGLLLGQFTVAKGQSLAVNLDDIRIRMPPTLRLSITGVMTSGSADLTAAITYYEDVF